MSRVIALVTCGFTLAACSASIPSLDFLKSSAPTASLRFESVPNGAEVNVSGQTCRTPCGLKLEVTELSATITHKGYEAQTISVRSESSGVLSAPRFVPNPVHVELRRAVASAEKRTRAKPASQAGDRSAAISEAPASLPESEAPAVTNNTAWTTGDVK